MHKCTTQILVLAILDNVDEDELTSQLSFLYPQAANNL